MIGEAAAVTVEFVVPQTQSLQEIGKIGDIQAGARGKFIRPCIEGAGVVRAQRIVRTEGGKNTRGKAGARNLLVKLQRGQRIFRGTQRGNAELGENSPRSQCVALKALV